MTSKISDGSRIVVTPRAVGTPPPAVARGLSVERASPGRAKAKAQGSQSESLALETSTEALRRAGNVHRNMGTGRAHEIYSLATGEMVAELHAREVWAWLRAAAKAGR